MGPNRRTGLGSFGETRLVCPDRQTTRACHLCRRISGLRRQSAAGAVPYLAAAGLRGSADARDDVADRRDVEDGSLWLLAHSAAHLSGTSALGADPADVAGGYYDCVRRPRCFCAKGFETDVRLLIPRPPLLRSARRFRPGETDRPRPASGRGKSSGL